MRHILYVMQFKGTATAGTEEGVMKATTSATSCSVKTVVDADGVDGVFSPADGGMAFFESTVKMTGTHKFDEKGSISFGDGDAMVEFSTVGEGHLEPSADANFMAGAVTWKIDRGEGPLEGATGYITSNFMISHSGEVTDYHMGVIFLKAT